MATRTVSNIGGNYNATGTWVEGVVPTSADDVVFTATSGQLTVNVTSVAKTFTCTNYTGTLTINATLTVSGNVTLVSAMTITTTSGTPLLTINSSATLTSNTKIWPYGLIMTVAGTYTLADTWTVNGNITIGNITLNGSTLNCAANFSKSIGNASGTTAINMTGTGTLNTGSSAQINNPFTINTSGTITISGTCNFANNITYMSGTIAGASTPIISIVLNTPTITLNALFTFAGTIQTSVNITFAGTNGFNIDSFICTTPPRTITFKNTNTYTINNSLTLTGTAANNISLLSSSAGSQAILTLSQGATQSISFVTATDINSSSGQTIWCWSPTLSNTLNWNSLLASVFNRGGIF